MANQALFLSLRVVPGVQGVWLCNAIWDDDPRLECILFGTNEKCILRYRDSQIDIEYPDGNHKCMSKAQS